MTVEMLCEFYLNDCRMIDGKPWYVGVVFEGRVRKGERFQELRRIMAWDNKELGDRDRFQFEILERCPIELEIQAIEKYGSLEQCDAGISCGIELAGKGLELLRDARIENGISFYDLLVIKTGEGDSKYRHH